MLPKVFDRPVSGFTPLSAKAGSGRGSPLEFQALLESSLAKDRPLEARVLSFLIEMIDKLLETPDQGPLPGPIQPRLPALGFDQPQLVPTGPVQEDLEITDRPPRIGERQNIDRLIREAAVKYDVDADLIRSVIMVESNFDPRAVSPAGAQGMMQLMPGTATDLGVRNPFDPGQNIDGGTRYLRQLLDRYGGNRRLALAAYNWGMGNLEKRPEALPRETQRYVTRVEKAYERYMGRSLAQAGARG